MPMALQLLQNPKLASDETDMILDICLVCKILAPPQKQQQQNKTKKQI